MTNPKERLFMSYFYPSDPSVFQDDDNDDGGGDDDDDDHDDVISHDSKCFPENKLSKCLTYLFQLNNC